MKLDGYGKQLIIISTLFIAGKVHADNVIRNMEQQSAHQQEQQKALQSKLDTTGKDVRSETPAEASQTFRFSDKPDCLKIKKVTIIKDGAIPHWLPLQRVVDLAMGHCMNAHNIKIAAITLQNKLIASGYITSRTQLPEQNIKNGELKVSVVSGIVGKIYLNKDANTYIHVANTFPTHTGKLLDLRDIEQGLENMQGIPSADVDIELSPSDEKGRTDVVISRQQTSFWRVAGWTDDSGSKSTGRYQAGLAFYLDNPTSLNDLFYVSATHDLQNSHRLGSKSTSANYTVPFGYWSFNLYASENNYHQPLTGAYSSYQYKGKNTYLSGKVSRVLHRGAQQKTTFSTQIIRRHANFHVGDVEMELQKLNVTNLRFDLSHRHYISDSVIDANLSFQRNVSWLGSERTASAKSGLASDLSRIVALDLQATVPFKFAGLSMSWQPHYAQQYSPDRLVTQDQFSIGNRWTVRGFDGENKLMGDRGWYLSNTINVDLPQSWNSQLYAGIDYGRVSRVSQEWVPSHAITGSVLGVRGYKWKTGFDLFAGVPVAKPRGLVTDDLTLGFTLQWIY